MFTTLELLQTLNYQFPPPENRRHSLTLMDDGVRIDLRIQVEEGSWPVTLDKEDLAKPLYILMEEILQLLNEQAASNYFVPIETT